MTHQLHIIFAYVAPETVMPLTSLLATAGVVVLLYGKNLFRLIASWGRWVNSRGGPGQAITRPHFDLGPGRRLASEAKSAGQPRRDTQ
jgi:hypothetical protein